MGRFFSKLLEFLAPAIGSVQAEAAGINIQNKVLLTGAGAFGNNHIKGQKSYRRHYETPVIPLLRPAGMDHFAAESKDKSWNGFLLSR
ncbi:hypothetical protein [Cyanobium sp. Morenito 9A2]|uniref:hypothetical protein n=1 Tax=Cyanobium sp. Morenito 9A2 TaxID=2823718 RepID=UPI0020CF198D|nr:hypothetical protein [Cyanobium sp. Morenito 9A2]MCP9851218.1 hypothetical protein [Cyanobium sp. Morenito 9A2]